MVDMTNAELDEVAAQLTWCKYQQGDAIVVKGDPADGLYQVLSGAAVVEVPTDKSGGPAVKGIKTLKPGNFFGEKALVSEVSAMRTATVRAAEKNTQCLRLGVHDFQRLQSFQSILKARHELVSPKQQERNQRRAAQQRTRQATMVASLFGELDTSRDGYLQLDEMQLLTRRAGGTLSASQYAQLCELVDTDAKTGKQERNPMSCPNPPHVSHCT